MRSHDFTVKPRLQGECFLAHAVCGRVGDFPGSGREAPMLLHLHWLRGADFVRPTTRMSLVKRRPRPNPCAWHQRRRAWMDRDFTRLMLSVACNPAPDQLLVAEKPLITQTRFDCYKSGCPGQKPVSCPQRRTGGAHFRLPNHPLGNVRGSEFQQDNISSTSQITNFTYTNSLL